MQKISRLLFFIVIALFGIGGNNSQLQAGITPTAIDYPPGTGLDPFKLGDVFDAMNPNPVNVPYQSAPIYYLPDATYPHFVNVLSFGADPTGQTDSWPAINAAMVYLSLMQTSGDGKEPRTKGIYFPKGTYLVSRTIDELWTEDVTGNTTSGSNIVTVSSTANLPAPNPSPDPVLTPLYGLVPTSTTIPGAHDTTVFADGTVITRVDSSSQIEVNNNALKTTTNTPLEYQTHACRIALIGESNDPVTGTIIKLTSNNPHFTAGTLVYGHPPPVIKTESDSTMGNNSDDDMIWNMTIDTGTGNPGAAGVSFGGNNMSAMRDVLVRSSDTANPPVYGIDMGVAYCGPCLLSDIEVDGFQTGIYIADEEDSVTIDTLYLSGQTKYGLENAANSVFINNLTSTNTVPAISNNGAASLVTVVNSKAIGGLAGNAAIANSGGSFVRNFTYENYGTGVSNTATLGTGMAGTGTNVGTDPNNNNSIEFNIADFDSHQIRTPLLSGSLLPNAWETPLNLPINATPTPDFTDDYSNWYSVVSAGVVPDPAGTNVDQTTDIQNAVENANSAHATTLYFPPGRYFITAPIHIHGTIQRILGAGGGAEITPVSYTTGQGYGNLTGPTNPVFIVGPVPGGSQSDMANTLEIDHLINTFSSSGYNNLFIEQTTAQTVVLRDCEMAGNSESTKTAPGIGAAYTGTAGAGPLYLEDCEGVYWNFSSTQNVWARQFDSEGFTNIAKITNTGGTLWVLGLKTEEDGPVLEATNGSKNEIDGGFFYCTNTASTPNILDVQNSNLSASFDTEGYKVDYPNLVGQTLNGSSALLHDASSGTGPGYAFIRDADNASMMPLVVAAEPPILPGIDVGSVGVAGSDGYDFATSTYTLSGAGAAIHDAADAFHYCFESTTNDCTIVAEVTSLQNTGQGAEAGVMMRATANPATDVGAPMIACNMFATKADYILRTSEGANATQALATGLTIPYWVKLVRSGSTYTSYYSADAGGNPALWVQFRTNTFTGTSPFVAGSPVLLGLDVCSGTTSATCTATFNNVTYP